MFFNKMFKTISVTCFTFCFFIFSIIAFKAQKLPDSFYVSQNCPPTSLGSLNLSLEQKSLPSSTDPLNTTTKATFKLFNAIPIKTVSIIKTERKTVVPGGIPFGIKIRSDCVVVAALTSFESDGRLVCPAKEAGIKIGDSVLTVNSKQITNNAELISAVNQSGGKSLEFKIKNGNGKIKTVSVCPKKDVLSQGYRVGISVRDSSAGIGTITFFDPQTATFGGLGHAVVDSASKNAVSLQMGNVAIATIDSVTKGQSGVPGQLNGHFVSNQNSGVILRNDETGVYGSLRNVKSDGDRVEVAFKQEVKTGKAKIIATIDGIEPQEFEIEIEQISYNNERLIKNMVIRVTDKTLLSKTGGIVQGMSGSPILQNGRLVGAVTHVFVNDCTRGYAIFAENMLETARSVEQSKNLKDAG